MLGHRQAKRCDSKRRRLIRSQRIARSIYYIICLSLRFSIFVFRPPGPASAGRVGLYILLLHFLFFDTGTYRWESAQQAPVGPIPTMVSPAELIKYPQTFDKSCPPFLQGSKMSQFLAQISTPIVFGPPYFGKAALYRKTKTNLSRTDDRSKTIPKLGWVGPPNSQNRWRNGYPKRVKVENFLYILRSSGPCRVQRHQCNTACWSFSCCKNNYRTISPNMPPYILQGAKNQQPPV